MQRIISKLAQLLEKGLKKEASSILTHMSPAEIVHILRRIKREKWHQLFEMIDAEKKRDVLLLMTEEEREHALSSLSDSEIASILEELASDDACRILRAIKDERRVDAVLSYLPQRKRQSILRQLRYSKEVAGGIMQREIITAHPDERVGKVVKKLKKAGKSTYTKEVYVVDEDGKLVGRVKLEKLITAQLNSKIKSIMKKPKVKVGITTDREEVANLFKKHKCMSIPVIENGKLVGVITIDEALKIMEEEHAEDIFKMFSLEKEERVFDPVRKSIRNRMPWLIINLFTAFLAASVVNVFEDVIKTFVLFAVFMPVVAGEGGNATTQTMAIVVRSLALREISTADFFRVVKKELAVALVNGMVVGVVGAAFAFLWKGSMLIALALLLAMLVNMVVAALAGATIPLLLEKLGSDPASSSTVILTTFTDIFGFLSFLGIGAIFLKMFGVV